MSTLSICSICQDEAEIIRWYLECCLHDYKVLGPLLKEVIIIDGGSVDETVDIIKSYQDKLPLNLVQHPFDTFGQQKNRAIEMATGDFIWGNDTDMTWTTTFPELFKLGYYDTDDLWDFKQHYNVDDAYHHFRWPQGVTMRLWRNKFRFVTNFHEKLEEQVLRSNTGRAPSVSDYDWVFDNSFRQSDAALWNRGNRYMKLNAEMTAAGGSIGGPDRYINAVHTETIKIEYTPALRNLVLPETDIPYKKLEIL